MYFVDFIWYLNDNRVNIVSTKNNKRSYDKEFAPNLLYSKQNQIRVTLKEVCPTICFKLNLMIYESKITQFTFTIGLSVYNGILLAGFC